MAEIKFENVSKSFGKTTVIENMGGLVFCLNEAGLFFRGAAGIDWK